MAKRKKTETPDQNALIEALATAVAQKMAENAAQPVGNRTSSRRPRVVRDQGRGPDDAEWKGKTKLCPKCGDTKKILPDFGLVTKRGIRSPQGWCRQCRNENHYYDKPRKYQTKSTR